LIWSSWLASLVWLAVVFGLFAAHEVQAAHQSQDLLSTVFHFLDEREIRR